MSLASRGASLPDPHRRALLRLGCAAAASAIAAPALARGSGRELSLLNVHTGERAAIVYCAGGNYLEEGLAQVSRLLRDHRRGEVHPIDTRLLDMLYLLTLQFPAQGGFHVVSAYRSPETNAELYDRRPGVARRSYHMSGQAVDIRLPGVALQDLHRAALSLGTGGVGYYPRSDFIHLDSGPHRHWPRV